MPPRTGKAVVTGQVVTADAHVPLRFRPGAQEIQQALKVDEPLRAAEAPEVDGLVLIEDANTIGPGDFLTVEITGAEVYDVRARIMKD